MILGLAQKETEPHGLGGRNEEEARSRQDRLQSPSEQDTEDEEGAGNGSNVRKQFPQSVQGGREEEGCSHSLLGR